MQFGGHLHLDLVLSIWDPKTHFKTKHKQTIIKVTSLIRLPWRATIIYYHNTVPEILLNLHTLERDNSAL